MKRYETVLCPRAGRVHTSHLESDDVGEAMVQARTHSDCEWVILDRHDGERVVAESPNRWESAADPEAGIL